MEAMHMPRTRSPFQYSGSLFLLVLCVLFINGCAFKRISRTKNITYYQHGATTKDQSLNVYAPRNKKQKHPVFIYVYGGNWTSGKKSLYHFFGSRWARKGVVTVIPDYPKSPEAKYDEMARCIAASVKWVHEHIDEYGGDPDRIFIGGHSAGGHLSALVSVRPDYLKDLQLKQPIKGIVLIDPAGLDMYGYIKEVDNGPNNSYLDIFSTDTAIQKQASPLYQLHRGMPPVLIYAGSRSYPSIITSCRKLNDSLDVYQVPHTYRLLKGKKHIPMITQFFNTYNPRYREIRAFMKQPGE